VVALSSCRECAGPSQQPGGGAWAVVTIARSSGLRSCGCCTRLRQGSSYRGLFKSIQDKHVLSLDSSSDDLVGSQRGGIPGVGGRSIRRTDRSPSLDLGLLYSRLPLYWSLTRSSSHGLGGGGGVPGELIPSHPSCSSLMIEGRVSSR
jgi:hypothetical protein